MLAKKSQPLVKGGSVMNVGRILRSLLQSQAVEKIYAVVEADEILILRN